jgi:hypothetical protein
MNFDAVVSEGRVHLLDVGLRCGGNYLSELIRLSAGVDLGRAVVHAALGRMYPVPARHVADSRWALSYIIHSTRPGIFRAHHVSPQIRPFVVDEVMFVQPGDPVKPYVQGDHGIGICLMVLPGREEAVALYPKLAAGITVEVG